ncbi:DUF2889 domain-containing protein [Hydrogenophaga sp. ANAO-22]|jgi:hypothetical protein|uniref:DUF2889 domain-containing protein n=1 Tax=Hydrogenophaga sp. ANAO-22 TaxID=3166645 RepID=UPI0036D3F6D6
MAGTPPPPVTRRQVHLRRIHCEGFERDDGLFDIVGTLIDTKPFPIELEEKSVGENQPIHHMSLCLTIDRDRLIHGVEAHTVEGPHAVCGAITESYRRLIGQRIQPGFILVAKRLFRAELGCTHMTELLPPMATTAFQMLWSGADDVTDREQPEHRNSPLGGCHALKTDGEIVRLHFPEQYTGKAGGDPT